MLPFTIRNKRLRRSLYLFLSAVFWTALWAFAAKRVGIELLLPSPARTFQRLAELMKTHYFWEAAGLSLFNILKGFLGGAILGTLLAIPTALFESADTLFSPINTMVRATPVASFIILALVWIDNSDVPSLIALLMVTPIVWSALRTAIRKIDPQLQEMTKSYRMSFLRRLRYLYLPSVLPSYVTSLTTSLGLAWKAGIAAEVLCRPKGTIGNHLYESKIYLETADLFAWTLTVILLSVLMELFVRLLLRLILRKETNT